MFTTLFKFLSVAMVGIFFNILSIGHTPVGNTNVYLPLILEASPNYKIAVATEYSVVQVLNIDGSDVFTITNQGRNYSWSPDGQMIVYDTDYELGDIHLVGNRGQDDRFFTEGGYPAWSPDGKQLAFYSYRDGDDGWSGDIYINDIDGSNLVRITYTESSKRVFGWSPDGSKIAYLSESSYGSTGIYTISADGTDIQRITPEEGYDGRASWSPDGSMFVSDSMDQNGDDQVYLMQSDGDDRRPLSMPNCRYPAFSPDGTQVAFFCSGAIHVIETSATDLNSTELYKSSASLDQLAWSPDGDKIAFGMNTGDGLLLEVHLLDIATGKVTQITDSDDSYWHELRWSPIRLP